jgi:heat-inducible transcriptional repressor
MRRRQTYILTKVVESYISTAQAVGSRRLIDDYDFEWSPATVRAELLDLEHQGYLTHPHTSAGRVPTEKGYRFYVDNLMQLDRVPRYEAERIENIWDIAENFDLMFKTLGQLIAELTLNSVIIAQNHKRLYFTGIRHLFTQPEFLEVDLIKDVSNVFDTLDQYVDELFDAAFDETDVLIGSDNPLNEKCSAIVTRLPQLDNCLVALLGPMRMDYAHNMALFNLIRQYAR